MIMDMLSTNRKSRYSTRGFLKKMEMYPRFSVPVYSERILMTHSLN